MYIKSIVFISMAAVSSIGLCQDKVSSAYFAVVQVRAQTEACAQKFPTLNLSDEFGAWGDRNAIADADAQKDKSFLERKNEMKNNMINSKRFTQETCVELKEYLLSKKSDAK